MGGSATRRNGNPLNGLDLQVWVKPPGESDGDCGVGAGIEAGDFSPTIAMKLLGH